MSTARTRREFVQALIVSVGGAAALGSCGDEADLAVTAPSATGRFYDGEEMALVSRLSELIIPRTETPGALDVHVPGYLDGLMADWASADTRGAHREALRILKRRLDSATGDFLAADDTRAETALGALDAAAFHGDSELRGYLNLKSLITQAYFATEAGALQEGQWVAVPGRWDPDVPLAAGQ